MKNNKIKLFEGVKTVPVSSLKKGDKLHGSKLEIVSVSAGARTPSGKMEVTVMDDKGRKVTKVWGKNTKVGIVDNSVNENQPAPSKPQTSPGPAVAPGKPGEKPGPRRPLGNPNVKPKPKAQMSEEEMLDKIVNRFKTKKDIKEIYSGNFTSEWRQGYKTGYNEGFEAAKNNKPNKFQK
jgi:hypothetical protein